MPSRRGGGLNPFAVLLGLWGIFHPMAGAVLLFQGKTVEALHGIAANVELATLSGGISDGGCRYAEATRLQPGVVRIGDVRGK